MKFDIPPDRIRSGLMLVCIALVLELAVQLIFGRPLISLGVFALALAAGAPRVLRAHQKAREPEDDAFDPSPHDLDAEEGEAEYATWFDTETWVPTPTRSTSDEPTPSSQRAVGPSMDANFARTLTMAQATLQAQASTKGDIHNALERLTTDIAEIKANTTRGPTDDTLGRQLDAIGTQLQKLLEGDVAAVARQPLAEAVAEALAALAAPDQSPVNDLAAAIERQRLVLVATGAKTRDEILTSQRQLQGALHQAIAASTSRDEKLTGEINAMAALLANVETVRAGGARQMADKLDRSGQQILSVLRGMRAESIDQGQETRAAEARQDDTLRTIAAMTTGLANRLREADARASARTDRLEKVAAAMRARLDDITVAMRDARTAAETTAHDAARAALVLREAMAETQDHISGAAENARQDAMRTRECLEQGITNLTSHITDERRTSDAHIAEHIDHVAGQMDAAIHLSRTGLTRKMDETRAENSRAAAKLDQRVGQEHHETRHHVGKLFKDAQQDQVARQHAHEKRTARHFEALRTNTESHIDQAANAISEAIASAEDGAKRREAAQTKTLSAAIEAARQSGDSKLDTTLEALSRAVRVEAAWLGAGLGARIEAFDTDETNRHVNTQTVVRSTAEREHTRTRQEIAAVASTIEALSAREELHAEKRHAAATQRLDDSHEALAAIIAAENANNRADIASMAAMVAANADHARAARTADNIKIGVLHDETNRAIRDGVHTTTAGLERIHADLRAAAQGDVRAQHEHITATAELTRQALECAVRTLHEELDVAAASRDSLREQIATAVAHIASDIDAASTGVAQRLHALDAGARADADAMRAFIRDALQRAEKTEAARSAAISARLNEVQDANTMNVADAKAAITTHLSAHHREVKDAIDGVARVTATGLDRVHSDLRAAAEVDVRAHQAFIDATHEVTRNAVARVLDAVQRSHADATTSRDEARAHAEQSTGRILRNLNTTTADLAARLCASETAARSDTSTMRRFVQDALDRVAARDDARATRIIGHIDHAHDAAAKTFDAAREEDRQRSERLDATLATLSTYARDVRHELGADIAAVQNSLVRFEEDVRLDAATLLARLDRVAERDAQDHLEGRAQVDARASELHAALRTVLSDLQNVRVDAASHHATLSGEVEATRKDVVARQDRDATRARRTAAFDRRDHARTHVGLGRLEGTLDLRTRSLAEALAEGLDTLQSALSDHAAGAQADKAAVSAAIQEARETLAVTLRASFDAHRTAESQAHAATQDAVTRVSARLGAHRNKARREHVALREQMLKGETATAGRLDQLQEDLRRGSADLHASLKDVGNSLSTHVADAAADVLGDNAERTAAITEHIDGAAEATLEELVATRDMVAAMRRESGSAQRAYLRHTARRLDASDAAAATRGLAAEQAADARAERMLRDLNATRRAMDRKAVSLQRSVAAVGEDLRGLAEAGQANEVVAKIRAADLAQRVEAVNDSVSSTLAHHERIARETKTQVGQVADALQAGRVDAHARDERLHGVLERHDARRSAEGGRISDAIERHANDVQAGFAALDARFDAAASGLHDIAADVRAAHAADDARDARLHTLLSQQDARRAGEAAREEQALERQAQELRAGFAALDARFEAANAQWRSDAQRRDDAARNLSERLIAEGQAAVLRDASTQATLIAQAERIADEVRSTAALASSTSRAEAAEREGRLTAVSHAHHAAISAKVDAVLAKASERFDGLHERADAMRSESAAVADRLAAQLDANTAALMRGQDATREVGDANAAAIRQRLTEEGANIRAHSDRLHGDAAAAAHEDAQATRAAIERADGRIGAQLAAGNAETATRFEALDQRFELQAIRTDASEAKILQATRDLTTTVGHTVRSEVTDAAASIMARIDGQAEHLGGAIQAARFDPSPLVAGQAGLARAVSLEARLTREAIQFATRHAVETMREAQATDQERIHRDLAKVNERIGALATAQDVERDAIEPRLAAQEARLAARVGESMRELHAGLEQAFAAHEARTDKIEATLPRLDMKLDSIMVAMDALESRVRSQTQARERVDDAGVRERRLLLDAIERLDARVDQAAAGIDARVTTVSSTLAPVAGRLGALQDQFDRLAARLDGLHAAMRARSSPQPQSGRLAPDAPPRPVPAHASAPLPSHKGAPAAVTPEAPPQPAPAPSWESLSASFSIEPAAARPSPALAALREDLARLEADLARGGTPDAKLAARIASMRQAYRALESRFAASS